VALPFSFIPIAKKRPCFRRASIEKSKMSHYQSFLKVFVSFSPISTSYYRSMGAVMAQIR
jgi:hypothetical protein